MPEWVVIYKAVADFSDLMRKAAEAKAVLEGLGDVKVQGGASQIRETAAAYDSEVQALRRLMSAQQEMMNRAPYYNRYVNWEGATTEEQYLANLQRERQYMELLWRAKQRGFYTPQQDYAFRNQEIQQWLQLDRAMTMGYASPDQYLNYLAQLRHATELQSADMISQASAIRAATLAWQEQADVLGRGTDPAEALAGSLGDLSSALQDVSGGVTVPVDVIGTPQALAALDAVNAAMRMIPDSEKVNVDVSVSGMSALIALAAQMARIARERPMPVVGPVVAVGGGGSGGGGGGGPPLVPPIPGDDAGAYGTLAAAEERAAAGARDVEDSTNAASRSMAGATVSSLLFAGALAGFATRIPMFGGLAGAVGLWHLALDGVIEALAILVPAVGAMVIGLGAFGIAATLSADTLGRIHDRLTAVYTASQATGQAIPPMTNAFDKLQGVIRPETWELYGIALNTVSQHMGLFGPIAEKTGALLDWLAARVEVDFGGANKGFETFMRAGETSLAKLGQIFVALGNALFNMIKVTTETHVDQYLLDILVAAAKLLDLITKLPTPLLAVAIGLHAIYLWGGLLVTGIVSLLGPFARLMTFLAGMEKASTAVAALADTATPLERLKATISDITTAGAALPGVLDESAAGGGLFASAAAALASVPLAGWAVLAVAAVGAFVFWSMRATDSTQQWVGSLQKLVAGSSVFNVINNTVSALGQVTQKLSDAQHLNFMDTQALTGAQDQLGTQLLTETGRVSGLAHEYGTNLTGAMALLATAQVKTSALTSQNNRDWETAQAQVAGLVEGYKMMGQGLTELQNDVSVQLVANSDQLASMNKLNAAYDTWTSIIGNLPQSFISLAQSMQQLQQAQGGAGASMVGLSANSLTLQGDFQTVYNNAEKLLDAFRSAEAVTGDQGFAGSTKELVAAMLPLAGNSASAVAQVSALAQEAGGPAYDATKSLKDNIKAMADWAGYASKDPLKQLYDAEQKMTEKTAGLSQEAQRLTTNLNTDLSYAMAKAVENAIGVQGAMNNLAIAVEKYGPKSREAHDAQVALTKSLQEAHIPASEIKDIIESINQRLAPLPSNSDKARLAIGPLGDSLFHLSDGAGAAALGMGQAGRQVSGTQAAWDTFLSQIDKVRLFIKNDIEQYAIPTLKGFAQLVTGLFSGAGTLWLGAVSGLLDIIGGFAKAGSQLLQLHFHTAFSDLIGGFKSAWSTVYGDSKRAWDDIGSIFSSGGALGGTGQAISQIGDGFKKNVFIPAGHFFGTQLPADFEGDAQHWYANVQQMWHDFDANIVRKLSTFFVETVPRWFTHDIPAAWDNLWAIGATNFHNKIYNPLHDLFTNVLPSWWHQINKDWDSLWSVAATVFQTQIYDPLHGLFTQLIPGWWHDINKLWDGLWSIAGVFFQTNITDPLDRLFTNLFPGWYHDILSLWDGTWGDAWSSFYRNIFSPMSNFFSRTLPGLATSAFTSAVNSGITILNDGIHIINDVLHAVHAPTIPSVPKLARGGTVPGAGDEDTVPALLTPGEYVIRKQAVSAIDQKFGPDFLDSLNMADGYARGGTVGGRRRYQFGGFISGLLGDIEGLGKDVVDNLAGLAGMVAGPLITAAKAGAKALFDAVYPSVTGKVINSFLGGSTAGDLMLGADYVTKLGVDEVLGGVDRRAQQFNVGVPGGSATAGLMTVARYMLAHGASTAAAAGIAGTVAGESGGSPEAVGSGGAGLIGWTPPSSAAPYQPIVTGNVGRDMAVQLVDMLYYIDRNGGVGPINAAGASGGPLSAAYLFSDQYERPLVPGSDVRPSVVNQIYSALGGKKAGGRIGFQAGGATTSYQTAWANDWRKVLHGQSGADQTWGYLFRSSSRDKHLGHELAALDRYQRGMDDAFRHLTAGGVDQMSSGKWVEYLRYVDSYRAAVRGHGFPLLKSKHPGWYEDLVDYLDALSVTVPAAHSAWLKRLTPQRGGRPPAPVGDQTKITRLYEDWRAVAGTQEQLGDDLTSLHHALTAHGVKLSPDEVAAYAEIARQYSVQSGLYGTLSREAVTDWPVLTPAQWDALDDRNTAWRRMMIDYHGAPSGERKHHLTARQVSEGMRDISQRWPGHYGYIARDLADQEKWLKAAYSVWYPLFGVRPSYPATPPPPIAQLAGPGTYAAQPPPGWAAAIPGGQLGQAAIIQMAASGMGWPALAALSGVTPAVGGNVLSGYPATVTTGNVSTGGATGGLVTSLGIMPSLPRMNRGGIVMDSSGAAVAGPPPTRQLSDAAMAALGASQQAFTVDNITINNPIREQAGESLTRAVNRLAFLAGRAAV